MAVAKVVACIRYRRPLSALSMAFGAGRVIEVVARQRVIAAYVIP